MFLNLFTALILFKFISSSTGSGLHPKNDEIIDAIQSIIDQMIKHHATINFITAFKDDDGKLLDFKEELLIKCKPNFSIRLDNFTKILNSPHRIKKNSIFLLDTIERFEILQREIVSSKFDFNGHFLFVLIAGFINEIEEIFIKMWLKNIYNVNVIYATTNETVLVSFLPFESSENCGSTKPKVINIFRNGKFENVMIFSQKMKNFNGCPLRVVTFEDEDVVMRIGNDEYRGYCIDLLMALAKQLNFRPDINFLTQDFPYGMVYDNGTSTGALGELHNNRSDIALGDFFLKPNRFLKFDFTVSYQVMTLVWIIPPGRRFMPIEKMLLPFEVPVWIFLIITITIGIIVILFINTKLPTMKPFVYGKNIHHPFLNMIIVVLGSQQPRMPKRNFARFLIMNFLLFTLVLRSIYQGSLFRFLQSDGRHKEVQSVEEMIAKDFTFYAFEASTLDLIKNSSIEVFNRTKSFKKENFLFHKELNGDEKIAALDTIKNVINANRGKLTINYCKEPFMYINIVLYLRKNSFIKKEFDESIKQLLAAGLIQQWIKIHHFEKYYKNVQKRKNNSEKKLSLHQLSGAFYLLLFGGFVAFVVFICEFLCMKFKRDF